jgi:predicted phosphodiesterase
MVRWGLISDVHGNRPALERAIAACRAAGVERLAYLGDLLGAGDPAGCVRLIRETAALSVVGNRDLDWADRVDAPTREYVLSLPRLAEADDFVAVHGDVRLTREFGSDDLRRGFSRAYAALQSREKRLLVFGHSHQARAWRKAGRDAAPEPLSGRRVEMPDAPETVYLLNVGTTGLPFPGKGPPCCAVYDASERWFEHLVLGPGRGKPIDSFGSR